MTEKRRSYAVAAVIRQLIECEYLLALFNEDLDHAAELTIDLGLHLQRIWTAVDALLTKHHVRYERVRADQRRRAEDAWAQWRRTDPVVAAFTNYNPETR